MKKFNFILLLLCLTMVGKAQSDCDCKPISMNSTFTDTLCIFNSGPIPRPYPPPEDGTYPDTLEGPCVIVQVNYTVVTCGSDKSIIINDGVLIDYQNYWRYIDLWISPDSIYTNLNTCSYGPIRQEILNSITKLVNKIGGGTSIYTVKFKSSCASLVKLSWPAGAFFDQPGGDGSPPLRIQLDRATSYALLPCDAPSCCEIKYKSYMIVTENGYTESRLRPAYVTGGEGCEGAPLPDYNNWPNKPQASLLDPAGNLVTVNADLREQEPCKPNCNMADAPPLNQGFTTDLKENKNNLAKLELTANPTLFNAFIRFSSSSSIKKVIVYDMSGKKVISTTHLENDELNTIELKPGVYFIQVYVSDNIVKTIKVAKQ